LLGLSPFSLSVVASCVRLQLKPLPSTGITRLRRYYEPLRHPKRPGLSLTSCQLIHLAITAGTSRVVHGPLCLHAVANTPAGLMEFVRSYDSSNFGLPRNRGGSAPALRFSRPAQRSLTLRPARSPSRQCDLLHRRLQQLRCLRHCFDCYRVERNSSRAGYPRCGPAPFTAHPALALRRQVLGLPEVCDSRCYRAFWSTSPHSLLRRQSCTLEQVRRRFQQ